MTTIYTDERSDNAMDYCNTCHCMFKDSGNKEYGELLRQSAVNREYLATFVDDVLTQECCEDCVTDIVEQDD